MGWDSDPGLTLLPEHPAAHAFQPLAVLNQIVSFSLSYVLRHRNRQKNPIDVIENP